MRISRIKFASPVLLVGRELSTIDTTQDKQYTVDLASNIFTVTNLEGHSVCSHVTNAVWWHPAKD